MGATSTPISVEAEVAALKRWRRGDARAADAVIMANQGMVITLAKKFAVFGASMSDLVQEGNIGLLRALEKYEPARGLRFITYAVWWVRAYMLERVRRDRSIVRHPTKVKLAGGDASLDAPWLAGADEAMVDRLPAEHIDVDATRSSADEASQVRRAMQALDPRERDIIMRRFFSEEPWTLQRLAYRHHLSRERVRQLERRALKKLRFRLAA